MAPKFTKLPAIVLLPWYEYGNHDVFRNLLRLHFLRHTRSVMAYLPHAARQRPERARFSELTPVVLRFADGNRASGTLQVVSVTGGLLTVPKPLRQGATAKLMFLTRAGSVLGVAEILSPLSWDQQPFRFISLHHDDETRLQAAIQSSREQNRRELKQTQRQLSLVDNFRAW